MKDRSVGRIYVNHENVSSFHSFTFRVHLIELQNPRVYALNVF